MLCAGLKICKIITFISTYYAYISIHGCDMFFFKLPIVETCKITIRSCKRQHLRQTTRASGRTVVLTELYNLLSCVSSYQLWQIYNYIDNTKYFDL